MDAIENIFTRRSIRKFTSQSVPDGIIDTVLRAGQAGPSCADTRPWQFVLVRDGEMLSRLAAANGPYAGPLKGASFGVAVCGDLQRAFPQAQEYWVIDGAIAAQNMILSAHASGVASVWLGCWPQMERVEAVSRVLELPEHIVPHSLIAFGYGDETPDYGAEFEQELIHYEKW